MDLRKYDRADLFRLKFSIFQERKDREDVEEVGDEESTVALTESVDLS